MIYDSFIFMYAKENEPYFLFSEISAINDFFSDVFLKNSCVLTNQFFKQKLTLDYEYNNIVGPLNQKFRPGAEIIQVCDWYTQAYIDWQNLSDLQNLEQAAKI